MMRVSVVIPVYNTAPYLARCLDSVFRQTVPPFEIIAVDDGSTDDSAAILAEYAAREERLRIVTQENAGLAAARNTGIAAAQGDYLAFLDSDDTLAPTFLEKMTGEAQRGDCDAVVCQFAYEDASGSLRRAETFHHFSDDPRREYLLSEPMACVRLIRREIMAERPFRKGIRYEDLDRMPSVVLRTGKIGFVDEALYHYFQREGSIMQQRTLTPEDWDVVEALEENARVFREAGLYERYETELEYLYLEHLFRTAALRFCRAPDRKERFARLKETVEGRFPHWRKNPYLKKASLPFRIAVRLAAHGSARTLACLAKLRGQKG